MNNRFYSFRVVTYNTNYDNIKPLLDKSFKFVYILHDKDECDNHFHVLCTFKQNKSFNVVRSLVIGEQNTFVQPIEDVMHDFRYLCHMDNPEKFQYDKSELFSNDIDYWLKGSGKVKDGNEEFVNDLVYGTLSYREMAIKYGRDYIRNFKSYNDFALAVKRQDEELKYGIWEINPYTCISYEQFLHDIVYAFDKINDKNVKYSQLTLLE